MLQHSTLLLAIFIFTVLSAKKHGPLGNPFGGKISIAVSERIPFVILKKNTTPSGLDIAIIENFAQKFNLQIEYITLNSSLNLISTEKEYLNKFSTRTDFR